jgi:hypothetical protein
VFDGYDTIETIGWTAIREVLPPITISEVSANECKVLSAPDKTNSVENRIAVVSQTVAPRLKVVSFSEFVLQNSIDIVNENIKKREKGKWRSEIVV